MTLGKWKPKRTKRIRNYSKTRLAWAGGIQVEEWMGEFGRGVKEASS